MWIPGFVWRLLILTQLNRSGYNENMACMLRYAFIGKIGDKEVSISYINQKLRVCVGGWDATMVNGAHLHLAYKWCKKEADARAERIAKRNAEAKALRDEIRSISRDSAKYQQVMQQIEEECGKGEVKEPVEPL